MAVFKEKKVSDTLLLSESSGTSTKTQLDADVGESTPNILTYAKTLVMQFIVLFMSKDELSRKIDLLRARAYAVSALLFAILYILVAEPLSCLFFESHPLRYKVQMYMYRPFEFLLEKAFDDIFDFEISGDSSVSIAALSAIISNHQGFIDYLTLMRFCKMVGVENSSYFFVWKHCVRLPTLRVLYNMWRKQTNWRVPNISLSETFSPVLESPWLNEGGKSIIIFPEVSPWTATNMLDDRAECADQGCPKLDHLLYPRFNAFIQTISYLRDFPLSEVYDVSTFYTQEGEVAVPSISQLISRKQKWKVHLNVKKYSATSLPQKEKHLVKWLEGLWFRKDQTVGDMKTKISQAGGGISK